VKDALGDLLLDIVDQDAGRIARDLVRMSTGRRRPFLEDLERDLQRFLVRYYGIALEDVRLGELLNDVFSIAFRHRLHLPPDLALLAKTLIVLEGVGLQLNPNFVLVEAARPFAARLAGERLSLQRTGEALVRTIRQAGQLAQAMPQRIDDLWDSLEQGQVTIGIDLRRLEMLIAKLDRVANRLAFSIIVAAIIIGSALVILGGAATWTIPIVGIGVPVAQIGFVLAGLMGAWLLYSILRTKGL